jgi:hypothetical protein
MDAGRTSALLWGQEVCGDAQDEACFRFREGLTASAPRASALAPKCWNSACSRQIDELATGSWTRALVKSWLEPHDPAVVGYGEFPMAAVTVGTDLKHVLHGTVVSV